MASLPRSCWALPLAISCALGSAGASGVYAAISVTETLLVDAPALADDTVLLYLDVIVNQVPTGHLLTVAMQDDRLHLWPEQLSRIGLLFEDLREQAAMPLDGIPDLEHRYDAEEQRLYLHAPAHRLGRSLQVHGVERTSVLRATPSPGALLNYDLHLASTDAGDRQLIAITGLRAFARQHVLENTAISRLSSWGEDSAYVRLDTQWTWSDQERLLTFTAGDFISGALPWTRATRMGGIQLRRNYSLRPDMITQPLPAFFGEAALPSQVELFVEGLRQQQDELLPGPYRVDGLPVVSGLNQAQVVLTDALGRTAVYDFSFYSTPQLLQRGLSDYSLELGSVRRAYGIESFEYRGQLAGSGSLRYGLTDAMTVEAHAEGSGDIIGLGGGMLMSIGHMGSVRSAWSASAGSGSDGSQLSLGYNWSKPGFTIDYTLQRSYRNFRDIASLEGRPPPMHSERLLLGVSLSRRSGLSLHHTHLTWAGHGNVARQTHSSVGLSFSYRLAQGSLFLSSDYEPQGHGGLSIHGGISMSLGAAVNGGAAMTRHRSGARSYDAYLRRGVPADGGTGWGIEVNDGRWGARVHADIGHRGEFMQVEAGVDALPRSTMIYADASGSVIWMAESSRQLFLARNIDSGFALVSTNGIPDVPVLLENRHIGDTNQEGYYLLTNLGAYRGNNVAFDPLHLPADARFDDHRVIAVPADRAGTMVDFGIRRVRSALLLLHDGMGNPMTMGSRISREGQMMAVVGHDGQAYLEDLSAHNSFTLTTPTGST